jgi:hypothetical protein
MNENTYLIRFKPSDLTPHLVIAASAEIHEEHLAFLRSDGKLAALCVLEIVESWSEFEHQSTPRPGLGIRRISSTS